MLTKIYIIVSACKCALYKEWNFNNLIILTFYSARAWLLIPRPDTRSIPKILPDIFPAAWAVQVFSGCENGKKKKKKPVIPGARKENASVRYGHSIGSRVDIISNKIPVAQQSIAVSKVNVVS